MDENRLIQLEKKVEELTKTVQQFQSGIYNFSDRQEWTKSLSLKKLSLKDNFKIYFGDSNDASIYFDGTNFVINGATLNFKNGIKANGTGGISTSFATSGTFTVTVTDGLITGVV